MSYELGRKNCHSRSLLSGNPEYFHKQLDSGLRTAGMTALEVFSGRTFYVSIFLLYIFLSSPAFASPAKAVSEGNKLYHQEKYDEAIKKYNEAKSEAPDSDIVNFDLGTALYKQGKFQEAADIFTKAVVTKDKKIEAMTTYNIANSKYKLGSQKENTDPNTAVGLYRESLDYYNRTIELDKNDKDAKYNHDLVEKRLKALEKLKNQQQQQQQNQKQDQKDKQDNKGAQEKSGQEKQDDKQQQKSEDRQAETAGDKNKKAAQGNNTEAKDRGAAGEKTREMLPEEARMLLDAYRAEEAGTVSDRERKGYHEEVLKDW
jgi:tetratricopeptide (TPR) repeat protein